MTNQTKGYFFAFAATFSLSLVYIFSKAALLQVSFSQFTFYWFGMAVVWSSMYSLLSGKLQKINTIKRKPLLTLLYTGIIEVISTMAIFYAILLISNPAIPSLLRNLEPVFITIFGIFLLRERYSTIGYVGVMLTILGSVVLSYKGGTLGDLFVNGSEFMLIATLSYAIRTTIVKTIIQDVPPIIVSLNKVVFLFAFAVFLMIYNKETPAIPFSAFWFMFAGSLVGPFFTSFIQNTSLQYIEASRMTLIQSTSGIFVLIEAFILYQMIPEFLQFIGGLITIVGVFFITLKRK